MSQILDNQTNLLMALLNHKPASIIGARADAVDIENRRDYICAVVNAVREHVSWCLTDLNQYLPVGDTIEVDDFANTIDDSLSDHVSGPLTRLAEAVMASSRAAE